MRWEATAEKRRSSVFTPAILSRLLDVTRGLLFRHRAQLKEPPDALLCCNALVSIELQIQFRLTRQDDLQQFFFRCFQVCEQTDFLQRVYAEMLRFVNNKMP